MTVYLKFEDWQQGIDKLSEAGFSFDESNTLFSGDGWGVLFMMPEDTKVYSNIYDGVSIHAAISPFAITAPKTPFNVRA